MGNRTVLEEDDASATAAGVDAEDPAGQVAGDVVQGEVPRGSGGAWLAHLLTLEAMGIRVA